VFDALHEQTRRLARIVDELATAAALESGGAGRGPGGCDVGAVAARALERAELRRPENVRLRARLPEEQLVLPLDEEKLDQILDALLDNAVRYSPDGGDVELSVERRGDVVRLAVRDGGIGIPHEHQARIGEKFYRVDPGLRGGVAGLGLGLYVCRRLLALMDGRLSFDSVEGRGSTFVVEIPAPEQALS
jgi:signal transduction histidine kinase